MSIRPLIVDWVGLRKMGWRTSRAHTWRLMFEPAYSADPFPKCHKVPNQHRNSRVYWRVAEVLAYFEAHGLAVTEDWLAPV